MVSISPLVFHVWRSVSSVDFTLDRVVLSTVSIVSDSGTSLPVEQQAGNFTQLHNSIQRLRTRGSRKQCNQNIMKPWMELNIQNRYWNTRRASAMARKPNTHVTPEMKAVVYKNIRDKDGLVQNYVFTSTLIMEIPQVCARQLLIIRTSCSRTPGVKKHIQ